MSSHQSVTFPRKKTRSRRRRLQKHYRGLRHLRGKRFPGSEESDLTESISSEPPELFALATFASSPITLNPVPLIPSHELQQRQLLQQRSLITNARQVIIFQLTSWWHKAWPTLVSASIQVGAPYTNIFQNFWDKRLSWSVNLLIKCYIYSHSSQN